MSVYSEPVTVTGNVVSFDVGNLGGKVTNLSIPLSPIQDLHGYANPWPAGGGANKWDEEWESGGFNLTTGEKTPNAAYIRSKNKIPVTPSTAYCFVKPVGQATRILWYDINGDWISSPDLIFTNHAYDVITSPYNAYYFNFTTQNTTYSNNISVNNPSSVTTYSPYSNLCPISGRTGVTVYVSPTQDPDDATVYNVDWTSEAGTVYGGTLDVVTGVLTVDTVCATKALSAFSLVETKTNTKHYRYLDNFFGSSLPLDAESGNLCNIAPNAYNTSDSVHFFPVKSNGRIEIWVPTDLPTSTEVQIAVPIATPLTYQLTPQEVELIRSSLNNIWNDAGQTTLTYALMIKWSPAFSVNNVDFSNMVERDSYKTALIPVFGQTIQTLNGVGHTAMLRKKGRLTVKLNPQTDADTAAVCAELLNLPCEVLYHCLQRDLDVTALMTLDSVSAQFLSRCLYRGQKWNQTDDITLTEL